MDHISENGTLRIDIGQGVPDADAPEHHEAPFRDNPNNVVDNLQREFFAGAEGDRPNVDNGDRGVKGHGQIQWMDLPENWLEKQQNSSGWDVRSSSREFHPPGDPESSLVLFYRGGPTSEEAGARFKSVLSKPPHHLSPEELASIQITLGNLANPEAFEIREARTEKLNGKMTLVVDGEWKRNRNQFHGVMIDADGTGTVVQELFFEAPSGAYTKHINSVVKALQGIRWKQPG